MYRNPGSHNNPFRDVALFAESGSRRVLGPVGAAMVARAVSVLPARLRE